MSSNQQFERARVARGPNRSPAPVLPAGWAPLTREQQAAVLQACDRSPQALLLRVSTGDPSSEYRVYRLDASWAGLCVASLCDVDAGDGPLNRDLLALAANEHDVVTVVVSWVNAEARLSGEPLHSTTAMPAVLADDPRRV